MLVELSYYSNYFFFAVRENWEFSVSAADYKEYFSLLASQGKLENLWTTVF